MKKCLIPALALAVIAGCLIQAESVAQKKGKTRPMTSSQLMLGLVKPKFVEIKTVFEKGKPETDDDWKALGVAAALLNESAYLMMDDGRCPDKPWKEGCEILKKSTADLLADIEKKDAEAAATRSEQIVQSCKVCHAEHKYKKK
jgi:cytochrome c553